MIRVPLNSITTAYYKAPDGSKANPVPGGIRFDAATMLTEDETYRDVLLGLLARASASEKEGVDLTVARKAIKVAKKIERCVEGDTFIDLEDAEYELVKGRVTPIHMGFISWPFMAFVDDILEAKEPPKVETPKAEPPVNGAASETVAREAVAAGTG